MASDLETTIGEIAADMGLPDGVMVFGEHDEAKRTTPPQIAWRLPRMVTRRAERQEEPEADTVCKTSLTLCQVYVWARGTKVGASPVVSDFEGVEALYRQLVASLFRVLGEQVFEIGDGTPSAEAKHANAGIAYVFPIAIKFPVYVEQLSRAATIQTLLTAEITDPKGNNPETFS